MIQRRRSPDGTNRDIDHGPGPVGILKPRVLGGALVSGGGMRVTGLILPPVGTTAKEWNKGPGGVV